MFYHPWRDLRNLRRDIQEVVHDLMGNESEWARGSWQPAVDMVETDDAFIVAAELPGMKKEDIKINVQDTTLRLSGARKPFSEEQSKVRSELWYGPFSRSISIPGEINRDKITAKYQDGILQVTLPRKTESRAKEIKIEVK